MSIEEKETAAIIYKTLQTVKEKFQFELPENISQWVITQFKDHPFFELEYFQISESKNLVAIQQKVQTKTYRAFIAVFVRDVRLIDNIALN